MAYLGSEAYRLDGVERQREQTPRPSLRVVEGGGADARVRQGVTEDFLAHVRIAMVAAAVFVALGVARVGITTLTVTALSANVALETQIEEAESANSDMRIERSILSSSARIERIAVQNYGMSPATTHDVVTLPASVVPRADDAVAEGAADEGSLTDEVPAEASSQDASAGSTDVGATVPDAAA